MVAHEGEPDDRDARDVATDADLVTNAEDRPSGTRRFLRFLRDVAVVVIIALVVSWGVKTFLVRTFYIPSESMVATLEKYDRVLVNELVPDVVDLKHGDVVVFRDTNGWLADMPQHDRTPVEVVLDFVGLGSSDSDQYLVKRVIGMPGDRVVCCDADNRLTINGEPIDEPYLNEPDLPASNTVFDVTVPPGKLWVMGDNRNNSADSRAHTAGPGGGFVSIGDVVGRAFVITWPVSRWSGLDDYPQVFEKVPAAK